MMCQEEDKECVQCKNVNEIKCQARCQAQVFGKTNKKAKSLEQHTCQTELDIKAAQY